MVKSSSHRRNSGKNWQSASVSQRALPARAMKLSSIKRTNQLGIEDSLATYQKHKSVFLNIAEAQNPHIKITNLIVIFDIMLYLATVPVK